MIKRGVYILLSVFMLYGCNHEEIEKIDKTSIILPNQKHLTIIKNNKETTSIGIITKHNYGTTHSYTYELEISPGNINWDGGTAEPKNIIFCEDITYIRFLKEKMIEVENTESTDSIATYSRYYENQEVYQEHIDNRYFFNLLGDDFWAEIDSEKYLSKKKLCKEYKIPNSNELSLELIDDSKL